MNETLSKIFPLYLISLLFLLGLVCEALVNFRYINWSIAALAIYVTTFVWYFVEFFYTPENFTFFSQEVIENSYFQIVFFLVGFRLLLPPLTKHFLQKSPPKLISSHLRADQLLVYLSIVWGILLFYGIFRLNGDVLGALFPLSSRAGIHMWARAAGADAGPTGFLVSAASYTYLLVSSFFGVLIPLQTKNNAKLINWILLCIVLPYHFLLGARNQLLVVILPGYFSYALFAKQKWWWKVTFTLVGGFILNQALILVIAYRNIGFEALLNSGANPFVSIDEQKHLGLNMLEELCYINDFQRQGILKLNYGGRYLADLLNFIPRAIWANKPLLGIDYALLRGFGGGGSDIGVFATISSGFIGQGVLSFGTLIGPMAPICLLALWGAWLSQLWAQRYSNLRLCLFLVALGITFNLGRDITLLVLFPVVFGYILVRFIENLGRKNIAS